MKVAGFTKKEARAMGQCARENVLQQGCFAWLITVVGIVKLMPHVSVISENVNVYGAFGGLMRIMMQFEDQRPSAARMPDDGAGGVFMPASGWPTDGLERMRILGQSVLGWILTSISARKKNGAPRAGGDA